MDKEKEVNEILKDIDCSIDDGIKPENVTEYLTELCKKMRDEGYSEGLIVGCAATMRHLQERNMINTNFMSDYTRHLGTEHANSCMHCAFWQLYDDDKRSTAERGYCRFLDSVTLPDFECRYSIEVTED